MPSFTRFSVLRVVLVLLLFCCTYFFRLIWTQRSFEHYLHSLSITFDDFPIDFSKAFIDAHSSGKPLEYDDYSSFPNIDPDATIPPIIHFIWFKDLYNSHLDVSKIPTTGSQAPEICQQHNPDFTINVWNASAARLLIEEHYAWFLPTYDGYHHPIQRVDAFKYFVIWHFGGVYMDLDIDCRRALYPITQFPAWFPKTELLGVNNDAFAARKHHPVIGEMTKSLQARDRNLLFPYLTIYWSTGPQFASDLLKSWFRDHREEGTGEYGRFIAQWLALTKSADPDNFRILPLEFYSEQYSFFGHSPGGTWHGWDVAMVLYFIAHPWAIPLVIGIPLCCSLLIWMRWRMGRRHGGYIGIMPSKEDES